jgi:regulator of protease activity HflC (stomatin/prohibitin superfamily)
MILSLLLACSTVTPGNAVLAVNVATDNDADRYSIIRGGRYWAGPNTDYYDIPTTEQRAVWARSSEEGATHDESITFAGVDGQPVNVDIGVAYIVAPSDEAIIGLAKKYGPQLDQIIDTRVRDSTRNAMNLCAGSYTVEQLYGEAKGSLMECAHKMVRDEYEPNGLLIERLTLNSEIRLPTKVREAMEGRITASAEAERVRREVETIEAEGAKKIAAARAEAEALRLEAESEAAADKARASAITPETIRLKELEVQAAYAEKWNGQLPTTIMGDSVPLLQLTK